MYLRNKALFPSMINLRKLSHSILFVYEVIAVNAHKLYASLIVDMLRN